MDAWHLQYYIHKIQLELATLEDFSITHIKRTDNVEEDKMSNWELTLSMFEIVMEDFANVQWKDKKVKDCSWITQAELDIFYLGQSIRVS